MPGCPVRAHLCLTLLLTSVTHFSVSPYCDAACRVPGGTQRLGQLRDQTRPLQSPGKQVAPPRQGDGSVASPLFCLPGCALGSRRSQTFFAFCFCHLSLFLERPLPGWRIRRGSVSAVASGFRICCQCVLRAGPLSQCGPQAPRRVLPDPLLSSLP